MTEQATLKPEAASASPHKEEPTGTRLAGRPPATPLVRRPGFWLLVILSTLILAGTKAAYDYYKVRESTDDAQIDGHINPISARVGGTIIKVNVVENQYVAKGTVLAQLDPRDYEVAVEKAKADLQEAEASANAARTEVPVTSTTTASQVDSASAALAKAESGIVVAGKEVDLARARLTLAKARLREADANYTKASQDLERLKLLIAKDEISRREYDTAVTAHDAAQAARDSARASVEEAEKGIETAEARLLVSRSNIPEAQAGLSTARTAPERTSIVRARAASAEAKVAISRAVLSQTQLNLDYTTIRAPVDGIIGQKNVELGQIVQQGQPLLAIVPLEDIWVKANFKENQLKKMRLGQVVEIEVDAYGGRTYMGHVESISAATGARFSLLPPENSTGNYVKVVQRVPLRIRFDQGQDPEHLLRPGMSVVPTVFVR
jgi:membrane fusion protein (multidrug efflux system)